MIHIPLRLKYRTHKPPGHKSSSSHSGGGKVTLWRCLAEQYAKLKGLGGKNRCKRKGKK